MYRKKAVIGVVGMVVFASVLNGRTEDTQNKKSDEKYSFGFAIVDRVRPDSMDKYLQTAKEFRSQYEQQNFANANLVFVGDKFCVVRAFPMQSINDLEQGHKEYERVSQAAGEEKWQKMEEEMGSAVECSQTEVSVYRPDLSYKTESSDFAFDPQKPAHMLIEYYYLKPGTEKKGEEIGRRMMEMQKEKKSPITAKVRQVLIGNEVPCYMVIFEAADRHSLQAKLMERGKLMEKDSEKLMTEARSVLRRVDRQEFHYDPALSYFPKNMMEEINADRSEQSDTGERSETGKESESSEHSEMKEHSED